MLCGGSVAGRSARSCHRELQSQILRGSRRGQARHNASGIHGASHCSAYHRAASAYFRSFRQGRQGRQGAGSVDHHSDPSGPRYCAAGSESGSVAHGHATEAQSGSVAEKRAAVPTIPCPGEPSGRVSWGSVFASRDCNKHVTSAENIRFKSTLKGPVNFICENDFATDECWTMNGGMHL